MLFNSFEYLIFFTLVFCIYWLLPHKYRCGFLLVASYYFYICYKPVYAILLFSTTVFCYLCGLLIEKYRRHGKLIVGVDVVVCFALLFYFKYFNFFCESINKISHKISFLPDINIPFFNILLPIGISFLIFQNVGYVIDVYRNKLCAEKHFGIYALFSSFFPQLFAGPIGRAPSLLPQLKTKQVFSYNASSEGLRLIMFGLVKKVAIADTIAIFVNNVYNNIHSYQGLPIIIATFLFTFQIYCDFAGYSDIAIGCSKLLGINLMTNFKSPYLSSSINEFWRNWHISLSTWFKDYLYIPLGGNRCSKIKHYRNLMITFLVSGLWHGANWTFIIWGGIHGFFQCVGVMIKSVSKNNNSKIKIPKFIKILFVFFIVMFAWIFFRANSLSDSKYILANLFTGIQFNIGYVKASLLSMGFGMIKFIFVSFLMCILFVIDYFNSKEPIQQVVAKLNVLVRSSIYIALSYIIIFSIMFTSQSQSFIYSKF